MTSDKVDIGNISPEIKYETTTNKTPIKVTFEKLEFEVTIPLGR